MANLLPQEYRKGLYREYGLRLAICGLVLLAFSMAVAVLLLAPSLILTEARYEQNQTRLDSVTSSTSSEGFEQVKDIIASTNKKLEAVQSSQYGKLKPTDTVSLITQSKPAGVQVYKLRLEEVDDEQAATINITGNASTRDSLLSFEKNLKNNSQVTSVELPISTLADRRNAEFSMTVTMKSN